MDLMEASQILGNLGEFFGFLVVLGTLVYLARQVRAVQRQMERDRQRESRDSLYRICIESDQLPKIHAAINEEYVAQSVEAYLPEQALMDEFQLSRDDALRWTRYLIQTWSMIEQEFISGNAKVAEEQVRFYMKSKECQLLLEALLITTRRSFQVFARSIALDFNINSV